MGLVPAKAALVAVLVLGCSSCVFGWDDLLGMNLSEAPAPAPHHKGGHHPHPHPHPHPPKAKAPTPTPTPTPTPSKPPVHPPSQSHAPSHSHTPSPSHAPVHPPTPSHQMPPRKFVAVRGVVYCKACKYTGVETLLGATPLLGAVVKLQCNNTKYPIVQQAKTDKNGFFFIAAPKTVTTYGFQKCKVSLVSSPVATCTKPTNLHYGLKGAILIPSTKPPVSPPHSTLPYQVFSVGPFAFEASDKVPCLR